VRRCVVVRMRRALAVYVSLAFVALVVFFLERNLTRPTGVGILFGPLNYLHPIFEFGVNLCGVVANAAMLLLLIVVAYLRPAKVYRFAVIAYATVWILVGFLAFVYEAEWPSAAPRLNSWHRVAFSLSPGGSMHTPSPRMSDE
jgi:hypothetical protein